jgi:hypothetical protein
MIKPVNKDFRKRGKLSSRKAIRDEKENTPRIIPNKRRNKKFPSICCQAVLKLPLKKRDRKVLFILEIASISLS